MSRGPNTESCATCHFWVRGGSPMSTSPAIEREHAVTGICQAFAPVAIKGLDAALWPQTHETRFCGAWMGEADDDDPDDGERVDNVTPLRPQGGKVAA